MMLDPFYGVGAQARAIFALLATLDPDFATFKKGQYQVKISTWVWYNGREKGICVTVQKDFTSPCLNLTFGEHRSSDNIFVDWWVTTRPIYNGPKVSDYPEVAYKAREFFGCDNVYAASRHIYDLMASFYTLGADEFLEKAGRKIDEIVSPEIADAWDHLRGMG
jgi:hypothetical protein